MPAAKPRKIDVKLSEAAERAVATRRGRRPGGSDGRLSADSVREAFTGRTFSKGEVMKQFGAAVDNATAAIAVLCGRRLLESAGVAADGTSAWAWVVSEEKTRRSRRSSSS